MGSGPISPLEWLSFLALGTVACEIWRSEALGLGRAAISLLLLWIRDGDVDEQYMALFALREIRGDAWGDRIEPDMFCRVVVDDYAVLVRPATREIVPDPVQGPTVVHRILPDRDR